MKTWHEWLLNKFSPLHGKLKSNLVIRNFSQTLIKHWIAKKSAVPVWICACLFNCVSEREKGNCNKMVQAWTSDVVLIWNIKDCHIKYKTLVSYSWHYSAANVLISCASSYSQFTVILRLIPVYLPMSYYHRGVQTLND